MTRSIFLFFALVMFAGGCLRDNFLDEPVQTDDLPSPGPVTTDTDSPVVTTPEVDTDPCPHGCFIDGECYDSGAPHAENPCRLCLPALSSTAWSDQDNGESCNDGLFCNGEDTCRAGACVANNESPCGDHQHCVEEATACECDDGWFGEACDRCIVFVDGDQQDDLLHDGTSWEKAFVSLCEAIAAAPLDNCEVWVAAGTYDLQGGECGPVPEERTFPLRPGLSLYGGFAGDETMLSDRNPAFHTTVLSGVANGEGNLAAYHVVTGADQARMDGFTVRHGNANGSQDTQEVGGGLYLPGGTMYVEGTVFEENQASRNGAAIHVETGTLELRRCHITANTLPMTVGVGGTVALENGTLRIADSLFDHNSGGSGGAIFLAEATGYVVNSTLDHNIAEIGGAIYTRLSELTLAGCLLTRHNGTTGGALFGTQSNLTITNCTFTNNHTEPGYSYGIIAGDRSDIAIQNSIVWQLPQFYPVHSDSETTWAFAHSDIRLLLSGDGMINEDPQFSVSPGVAAYSLHCANGDDCSPCVDVGSPALLPADIMDLDGDGDGAEPLPLDLAGNPRHSGDAPDMGAYEFQTP